MIVRRAVAVVGLLLVAGLAARAQEPAPAAAIEAAARSVARGGTNANVVPGTFRAQLVVDRRFPLKGAKAEGEWPECAMPPKFPKDEDRDPRDRTGKMHCLVCEHGLSPVVAVFVRDTPKAGDGLSKLVTKLDARDPKKDDPLDGLLTRYRADKLAAFVMFLKLEGGTKVVTVKAADGGDEKVAVDLEYPHDEKRADKVKEVQDYACAVKADKVPFGLAAEKSAALSAFAVGDATPVTVVIYSRLRVVQRWELKMDELTDAKVAEILAATKAMIDSGK